MVSASRTHPFILAVLLLVSVSAGADETSLLRVFLVDGTTLTSFGEYARVGDRDRLLDAHGDHAGR